MGVKRCLPEPLRYHYIANCAMNSATPLFASIWAEPRSHTRLRMWLAATDGISVHPGHPGITDKEPTSLQIK